MVDAAGRVTGKMGHTLRQFPGKDGYLRFTTFQNGHWQQVSTHVMVCSAFHGPRPEWADLVAHGNGDKTDNHAENLRWATYLENEADKRSHGRNLAGERHHQAKLTADQVREIRSRPAGRGTGRALAREFGVTEANISAIRRGRAWRHLS
jgi:hypothetical protein